MPHSDPKTALSMAMASGKIALFGFAWYEEADYPAILRIMVDRDRLPARFADWERKAKQQAQDIEQQGGRVIRVVIKPEPFRAWCLARGCQIDANARAIFANEQAGRQAALGGI